MGKGKEKKTKWEKNEKCGKANLYCIEMKQRLEEGITDYNSVIEDKEFSVRGTNRLASRRPNTITFH